MILHVAEGLAHSGYRVDLVLVRARGPYLNNVPSNVRLVDLACGRMLKALVPTVRYLRREQPDVMLSTLTGTNVIALAAKRIAAARVPVIIRIANMPSVERRNTPYATFRMVYPMMRYLYRWADQAIAISAGVGQDLVNDLGLNPARVNVIHNPVLRCSPTNAPHDKSPHECFTAHTPPVILGAGRLVPQKDFATLIRALAKVRETTDAKIVILGEGPEEDALKTLAKQLNIHDHIRFLGFVSNPREYMAAASVFVFSSAWEGFGNVLVEAMAVGTPVISTDCPSGPSEILDNGRYGTLVPVGNPDRMAQAILETLNARPDTAPARARAMEFSLQSILPKYIQVLQRCTGIR